ncbi:MAG: hypothetical protein RI996_592 [Candidatus Parcubacteria bacterium]|jgi:hypothetical protein
MEPIKGTEETLQELLLLTRENNKILHGIRNRERIAHFLRIFYIGFLVLSFYGAYVFAQPYIAQIQEMLQTAQNIQSSVKTNVNTSIVDPQQVQNLLNAFQVSQQQQ